MFVETYYDERSAIPASTGEPPIPYPELLGEAWMLWRRYLPVRSRLGNLSRTFYETIPNPVIEELARVQKEPRLFDRIEVWSRRDPDPMLVGINELAGEKARYYSIARWGDAKLTIAQVKKRLRLQQLMFWLTPVGVSLAYLAATLLLAYGV